MICKKKMYILLYIIWKEKLQNIKNNLTAYTEKGLLLYHNV